MSQQQHEDPAEAATLPYDPEEMSLPLHDDERVEEHDNHDNATLPADPPTQESQPLYRSVLAHNPALRTRASPRNTGPDAREMLDREIAHDTEFGLNDRSPETSQKSTLTDTQFSSPPNRLVVREYEGSDSSQVLNELRRYTNPLNDLGSQDSIRTQFYVDNYDRQHRMDIKGPKRSNSAIVDDGPEFKRQKYHGVYQQNSDLTDYLGNHGQAKCFFTDKQKALINPRFQMQKYPDRERAKTFAGKLNATARLHAGAPRSATTANNSGILDNLPQVTVEQLKYNYNLSLSSDDMQGSPESQRNPYISPQRQYNRTVEDTSPLRYPSPHHPSSSSSSLGPSGRDASTQSISSHGRVSNMSDEVRGFQELCDREYINPEERFGWGASSDPGNDDFADLTEFYSSLNQDDESRERGLTPELEDSTVPRDEVQDHGPSEPNEDDATRSNPLVEATSPTKGDISSTIENVTDLSKSTSQPENSTDQLQKSTSQPQESADQPQETADQPQESTSQPQESTSQPQKSTSLSQKSTNKPKNSTNKRQKSKDTKEKERAPRRSSRIKEHAAESVDYKAGHIKVMLSSGIDKAKRTKYKNFVNQKGALTDDFAKCTIYVSADIKKDTTGSICALIMGKDVVDSSWLDTCIEEKAFIDYKCREFPRAKLSQQPMKGKSLHFSKDCGFTFDEKRHISKAVGAKLLRTEPAKYHEETVVVIKDSNDPSKKTLTDVGYKVTTLDEFIEPLARSL